MDQERARREVEEARVGSGGYIVVEMPEEDRPLFHDLLKGFEDYAKLKGYQISFSIDSSSIGRIAFKFTVKNDGVVVGPNASGRISRSMLKMSGPEQSTILTVLP
jgi:DNA-binding LacI/PurR family transcriptional regulator